MKKFLLTLLILMIILLNAVAIYAVVDTYVLKDSKKEAQKTEENSEEPPEEVKKPEKKPEKKPDIPTDPVIGLSDEVIREREEAQRQLEEALARKEEKTSLKDDLSEKIADLANPILEKHMTDFSEYVIHQMKGDRLVVFDKSVQKYGVVDMSKAEVLAFSYDAIEITEDDFYIVKKDGKFGVLDSSGIEIIDNTHDSIRPLVRGYFLCKANESGGTVSKIYNRRGDVVFKVSKNVVGVFEENTNYFKFESGGKYGIVDILGEERLKPVYDDVMLIDGKLYYKEGTKIGVIP